MTAITDIAEHRRGFNAEVRNGRDLDAIERYIHGDFVLHDPALPEEVRGPEAVREYAGMPLSSFPDTHAELVNHVSEGDMVAVHNVVTGTHEREYLGTEPTGRPVEFQVFPFRRVDGDRVVERWILADQLTLMQRLGLADPMGEET